MSYNYDSLDDILTQKEEKQLEKYNKNFKHIAIRDYIQFILTITIILINSIILYIICYELKKFYDIFSSFSSNINTDVNNFNDFLQVIPQLKDVLNIILNLCSIETIHPFCNNTTDIYNDL